MTGKTMSVRHGSGNTAPAAGWYINPERHDEYRWWNGVEWTTHVAPIHQPETTSPPHADIHPSAAHAPTRIVTARTDSSLFTDGSLAPIESLNSRLRRDLNNLSALGLGWTFAFIAIGASMSLYFAHDLATHIEDMSKYSIKTEMRGFWLGLFVIAMPFVIWYRRRRRASQIAWSTSRGIPMDDSDETAKVLEELTVPLVTKAKSHTFSHTMRGRLAEHDAIVTGCVCTIDNGSTTAGSSTTWDLYSLVVFELPPLVAARYEGVSVRRRAFDTKVRSSDLGDLVSFESSAVESSLAVYTSHGQDPIALRELFASQLLAWLGDHPTQWDQRSSQLVVFERGMPGDPHKLDDLCQRATYIYESYLRESR